MANSIMQASNKCYRCRRHVPTQEHHCINGTSGRKLSDKYGLTVRLCPQCHEFVHSANGTEYKEKLKRAAQQSWQEVYGKDAYAFREVFGKSWLPLE